jgi:hypothetical protein
MEAETGEAVDQTAANFTQVCRCLKKRRFISLITDFSFRLMSPLLNQSLQLLKEVVLQLPRAQPFPQELCLCQAQCFPTVRSLPSRTSRLNSLTHI